MNLLRFAPLAFACSTTIHLCSALAGDADWPQWRGPARDGHAAPQTLLQDWPEGGPKVKWEFRGTGVGYTAPAIVGDKLFTMGTKGDKCFAICISAGNGQLIWETPVSRASSGEDYAHGWGGGPRSTPTIDGDHVYVLSDVGVLACLQTSDGKLIWSADFVGQYGGAIPKWGYSESVLIDGDRVLGTPGGENFVIGLDKKTGNKLFGSKNHNDAAQYVSIIKHTFQGTAFYVTAGKRGLVGIDANDGSILFTDNATGNDVAVIPTAVIKDDLIYHTSDYGAGNTLLQLKSSDGKLSTESLYHLNAKSMQNHHGGVVLVDGVIYGFTKTNGGEWMAQDLQSGDTLWSEKLRPNRSGAISYADNRLYCYNDEDGSVVLVEPSRSGWKAHGTLSLPEKTKIERGSGAIWSHPTIANQTLFLRDQDLIFAFDIAR